MGPRVQGVGGWGGLVFAHLISRIGVGPAVEQQAHHLEVALAACCDEGRFAVLPAPARAEQVSSFTGFACGLLHSGDREEVWKGSVRAWGAAW
jgi:hypothetical protein